MKHIAEQFKLNLMNTKKINSIAEQIYEADAIIIDNSGVLTNNIRIRGMEFKEETNEVLHIEWDSEGEIYSVVITEEGLDDAVVVTPDCIVLKSASGEVSTIKLLTLSKKEVIINW